MFSQRTTALVNAAAVLQLLWFACEGDLKNQKYLYFQFFEITIMSNFIIMIMIFVAVYVNFFL